jgi:hypothetical protein
MPEAIEHETSIKGLEGGIRQKEQLFDEALKALGREAVQLTLDYGQATEQEYEYYEPGGAWGPPGQKGQKNTRT